MVGPKVKITEDNYLKIKDICASYNNNPGELINVLHKTQGTFGYLPEEVQQVVADCLGIPVGRVYGVVSFYSFFTMKPKGKYAISVCLGTACYVKGAEKILDALKSELAQERAQDFRRRCHRGRQVLPGCPPLRGRLRPGPGHDHQRQDLRPPGPRARQGDPGRIRRVRQASMTSFRAGSWVSRPE